MSTTSTSKALSSAERHLILDVYLEGHPGVAGRLVHTGTETTFAYDLKYVRERPGAPLSLPLPVENRLYGPREALPYFENLLPEGKRLNAIALQLGLDERDLMGILEHVGRDCAGAVSIVAGGGMPSKTPGEFPRDYEEIAPAELLELMETGIDKKRPAGKGQEFSLAGVQGKAAVVMDVGGKFYQAKGGAPSTHIVKLPDAGFAGMIENEAFCLDLARAMGLDAVEPRIITFPGDRPAIVVPRYDREAERLLPAEDGNGILPPGADGIEGPALIRRIHQEDFAQALGYTSDRKCTHRGGPRLEQLLAVDKVDAFASFRLCLLDAIIFNFLIGNSDAHAKNYSLLHGRNFRTRLAPLYDLLSIVIYPQFRQGMALTLGAEDGKVEQGFADFDRGAIERAAGRLRMRPSLIRDRLQTAARKVLPTAHRVRSEMGYGVTALKVISAIGAQVGLLNEAFDFRVPVEGIAFEAKSGGWQRHS